MAIIDNAQARVPPAGPAQQAAAQPRAMPAEAEQGQAEGGPSDASKDVLIACLGMLYDERVGVARKLAEQLKRSRDPAAIIANSAHDIVASAVEKTGVGIEPNDFKRVASMIVSRLAELADAVGVQLTEEDAVAAAQMLNERAAGGDEPPPEAQAQAAPAPEQMQ